jgi:hypothetical protein
MDWAYYPLNIYHMVHWAEFIYSISHVIFEFGDLKVLWMYPLLHRNVYGRGAALGFLSNREWSSTVASSPIQAHTCATIINYVYLSIYLFTATYIYIHMCIYICICIYLYIYMYIYTYTYIYIYIYIYTYVCIYIYNILYVIIQLLTGLHIVEYGNLTTDWLAICIFSLLWEPQKMELLENIEPQSAWRNT